MKKLKLMMMSSYLVSPIEMDDETINKCRKQLEDY